MEENNIWLKNGAKNHGNFINVKNSPMDVIKIKRISLFKVV